MLNKIRGFLAVLLVLSGAAASRAALADQSFCIDPGHQPTDLFTALTTWRDAVSEQITIKVVGGTFGIGVSLMQLHDPPASLVLLGGYAPNTNCNEASRDIQNHATVFDGGGNGAFAIEPAAPITIDGLTFRNYYGGNTQIGGLTVYGVYILTVQSDVTLTRFILDHDETFFVENNNSAPTFALHDCLVKNQPVNATHPALRVLIGDGTAYVQNCTLADNAAGGLQMETYDGGQFNVYNTISFNNGGSDFFTGHIDNTPNVSFSLYESGSGFNGFSNIIPVSNYTLFNGPGDYHLAQTSPAINAGDPGLSYAGQTDLDGNARVSGGRIDIGAYESNFVPNQYKVNSQLDDGSVGTLRWAIGQANGHPTTQATIVFDLSSFDGCPYPITLDSALPDINAPVFIDGTTQPGWVKNSAIGAFNGTLCVRITSGVSMGYALHVAPSASGSQLVALGMIFDGFSQAAIKLEGGSGHNIGGNRFGGSGLGTNHYGVQVSGSSGGAQIGGSDAEFVNLFDDASQGAIYLGNSAGGSLVQNNVIGVGADGSTAAGSPTGIFVTGSPNNTLRSNYIGNCSATTSGAIVLYGAATSGNVVQQNQLGWDFYGDMPNAGADIFIANGANNNLIGSSYYGLGSGNNVRESGAPGVWIASTAGTGNAALGNDFIDTGFGTTFADSLAIDLGGAGPDASTAQGTTNYPVLQNSFAMPNNQLIKGTLDAAPTTMYRIDSYHYNTAPPGETGRGQAGLFVTPNWLITDANGHCSFLLTSSHVLVGGWLSATATAVGANTSEIGNAVPDQLDGIFIDGFGGPNACQ